VNQSQPSSTKADWPHRSLSWIPSLTIKHESLLQTELEAPGRESKSTEANYVGKQRHGDEDSDACRGGVSVFELVRLQLTR
jgi:hypothetical protein